MVMHRILWISDTATNDEQHTHKHMNILAKYGIVMCAQRFHQPYDQHLSTMFYYTYKLIVYDGLSLYIGVL